MLHDARINQEHTITIPSAGPQNREYYFAAKRCFDLALAGLLLLMLSPLLLVIAALIKLDSPGPALFVQERVGSRRRTAGNRSFWEIRTFRCLKFRSMVHNADQSLHQAYIESFISGTAEASAGAGPKFKLTRDPRVTRVGHILRKTSLDELPQLLNVLKGEMSLVGPRPVPTYEVASYQPRHYQRLAALPGMTGLWQIKGRGEVSFEEMITLDIEYVDQATLWSDLKILALTIPAVISGRGAE